MINYIFFESDSLELNKAYRIAVGDLVGNIMPYKDGLLEEEAPCLLAGIYYNTPWTRDTAINVWNALAILSPEVSKNTLLSVCCKKEGKEYIGIGYNQYWDCIVWVIGAYQYCKVNCDDEFLRRVFQITLNTLDKYEKEEFDDEKNLFRGPAVYGDGTAAYPDKYGIVKNYSSCVLDWGETYPEKKTENGYGIPMFSLSTNCVYSIVYDICVEMAEKLGENKKPFKEKAKKLKEAINKEFWNEQKQTYDYLAHECDHQEGLGLAFALLGNIADKDRARKVIENAIISSHGITCVWPSFERYLKLGNFGRHSGTVWPFIQGFWGQALLKYGYQKEFDKNLYLMAEKACRDGHFAEIYHGETGEIYGGLQENPEKGCITMWESMQRQSWSASAFLSLIYYGILGVNYTEGKLTFKPYLPEGCNWIKISGFPFGDGEICLKIDREMIEKYEVEHAYER